jgi:hypothetical protein
MISFFDTFLEAAGDAKEYTKELLDWGPSRTILDV